MFLAKENMSHEVCQRCGRKLKSKKCIAFGYGLACYKKMLKNVDENQLTLEEVLADGKTKKNKDCI